MRNIFWSSKVQLHIRIIWSGGKGVLKNMNVCSKQIYGNERKKTSLEKKQEIMEKRLEKLKEDF